MPRSPRCAQVRSGSVPVRHYTPSPLSPLPASEPAKPDGACGDASATHAKQRPKSRNQLPRPSSSQGRPSLARAALEQPPRPRISAACPPRCPWRPRASRTRQTTACRGIECCMQRLADRTGRLPSPDPPWYHPSPCSLALLQMLQLHSPARMPLPRASAGPTWTASCNGFNHRLPNPSPLAHPRRPSVSCAR